MLSKLLVCFLFFILLDALGLKLWNLLAPYSNRITKFKLSFHDDDSFAHNDGEIQVFTTVGCKYCRIAKAKLKELGINQYKEFDISQPTSVNCDITSNYGKKVEERLAHAKSNTVPQIYIGTQIIGGCNDLLASVSNGSLFDILAKNKIEWKKVIEDENSTSEIFTPFLSNSPSIPFCNRSSLNVLSSSSSLPPTDFNVLEFSSRLQLAALQLTDNYVSADGKRVDYQSMRISTDFAQYIALSEQLQYCSLQELISLSDQQKLVLFSNIYNAMIIHANAVLGSPSSDSPTARSDFFSGRSGVVYCIGKDNTSSPLLFSPDDIEHGILRANMKHPYSNTSRTTFFESNDVRSELALQRDHFDPRIHFILNCGASSCPPIKVLTLDNVDAALEAAAAGYLHSEVFVIDSDQDRIIRLPRLLLWYGCDFGNDIHGVLAAVERMLPLHSAAKETLHGIIATGTVADYTLEYNAYDWSLNETN